MSIDYIMVADLKHFWNNIYDLNSKHEAYYWDKYVPENIKTAGLPSKSVNVLYIRKDKQTGFESAWIGEAYEFRDGKVRHQDNYKKCVWFKVNLQKEVTDLIPAGLQEIPLGWHKYNPGEHDAPDSDHPRRQKTLPVHKSPITLNNFTPSFFSQMAECKWQDFEIYCFHLLQLLGIIDIHRFPNTEQQGKADGFFKIGGLSILYDATINPNFENIKGVQINNFISQLQDDKIKAGETYTIKGTAKQVWIITRGAEVKLLDTQDGIKAKEIPFTSLINIYNQRIDKGLCSEELVDCLKNLK